MARAPKPPATGNELPLAHYEIPGCSTDLHLGEGGETVWATQGQIAQLFDVTVPTVSHHLKSVFSEGELSQDSVVRNFLITAKDGKNYNTLHYNLDAILSVGYRVSGPKATQFRQWATRTLRAYVEQGYVLNEVALRQDPAKLNELAARVRALRSEESNVYARVRECFKVSASDYEPSSQEVRTFYALLQDKFHHAVTRMTSSKLILDRANHVDENMGLVSFGGKVPTLAEVKIGKNYLKPNEMYQLHLLSEQFLLFAESSAIRGRKMTMKSLSEQLDRLLTLNDYPVFGGYTDYIKDDAIRHAAAELKNYRIRLRVEDAGVVYDPEDFASGHYREILE